jgi:hypothetical protein
VVARPHRRKRVGKNKAWAGSHFSEIVSGWLCSSTSANILPPTFNTSCQALQAQRAELRDQQRLVAGLELGVVGGVMVGHLHARSLMALASAIGLE